MDRFEAMKMLVVVVEQGSLSAAGRNLRVPVPTLSRKISELEAQVGARLLIRTTRKLSLTDAGITYVAAARRILEQVEEAECEAAGEYTSPRGDLVIAAPLLFGRLHVLPVVADFLALYPEINVRLVLSDRNVALVEDHVDMAVRIGNLPDSSMIATKVGTMRSVFCASPALIAGHGEPLEPEDLRRMPCIAVATPMPYPTWQFRRPGSAAPIEIAIVPRLSVTTPEAAADAAIRGLGVTRLLGYQVAVPLGEGQLQTVLREFEPDAVPVHLLHVARGQMPIKMRRFLDFAVPRLRNGLEAVELAIGGQRVARQAE